jgi:hypothetical protein
MCTAANPTREDRTITVDFRDEASYLRLIEDGQAFLEYGLEGHTGGKVGGMVE